jgi:hypothetical protein
MVSSVIPFSDNQLHPTPSARNLGFIFDSDLSHTKHISSVCQSSFFHIRQLRQIRPCLDQNSATILANSLVSTKLDYCNSLYYGLPASSIKRLQLVQNTLARVVVTSVKRRHHISPILKKLHWLPVNQRITYKIATIIYKTLQNKQPSYLFDLLTQVTPSGRRSSTKFLLDLPRLTSSNGRRSFTFAAPTIWNSIPLALRQSSSIMAFRSGLKTYLFPP